MPRIGWLLMLGLIGCGGGVKNVKTTESTVTEAAQCEAPRAPVAKREAHESTKHGVTWSDPYRWMRRRDDPEVIAYLEAENEYADAMLRPTEELQRSLYDEMLSHIDETDLTAPYRRGDYLYYTRTVEGKNYEIYCRKKGSLDAPEEVLLDENELAEDHDYFALGVFAPSPDGRLLAYSYDTIGNERYVLVVKDLETGELLDDEIDETYYGVAWANDDRTLFYTRVDPANRPFQLFRHRLGTSSDDDSMIFEEPDERFFLDVGRSRSGEMLLATLESSVTTEVRFLSSDRPEGDFEVVVPRKQDVEYYVDHHSDRFFILTNEEATNFRLFEAPVDAPQRENWTELVPHRDDVTLRDVDAFADHLVLWERRNGLPTVRIRDLRTGDEHTVEFPEPTYAVWRGDNYEFDTKALRFIYTSLVTPRSVFDYDMDTGQRELIKQKNVPGFDPGDYRSARITASASDGESVPISLVWRSGAREAHEDPTAPLLLTGYGSYGASFDPYFSAQRLALVNRGVIFAIAHVRGGGEKGRRWYEEGKYLKKKKTFHDFIAAAEHLVEEGWTAPEKLAISGRSAGGLLVGAALNMRPELFAAAVASVPFVDVLNTMLDPTIPLTVIEWEEWGNPNDPEYFEYIRSYAPYENVDALDYPAILVTAGLNDPRVAYWEPAKWVARLRAKRTGDSELLLRTNMGAGHGGASGRYDYLRETAVEYAFILKHVGAVELSPACR